LTKQTPENILKNVFGYDQFHPHQREVIENVLKKRDSLVIMPTGGGKSLCYQIPALIFPGLTVVVSPLIALMKDQVEQMRELGVTALFLNSSLSYDEYLVNVAQVRAGKIKLLYVAPETLLTDRLLDLLASVQFDFLAIDEAHCISEWGHDFRPEYRQLVEVRKRFPQLVCLALTATATDRVRQDIQASLAFETSNEFIASFDRTNLLLDVVPKNDPLQQTLNFLKDYPNQPGIIYCFSRKQVDDLAAALDRKGFSVRPYHAGLSDQDRKRNQDLFIRDDIQIIVATIAFGMGINKINVRFVIHYDLPKSIESYYQEIGRAGRDGLPAHCMLLFSYGDIQKLRYFLDQKDEIERQAAYQHLNALMRYAESEGCRRVPLLAYFGETYSSPKCGNCDRCQGPAISLVDITTAAQKFLSCVIRTGETFGAGHVADVLVGADNQKIRKFNHQTLTTYGIGEDMTRGQWMHLSRQLLQKGLLAQDERYGSLKLTSLGHQTLRNRTTIEGTLQATDGGRLQPAERGATPKYDRRLFDLLRLKRKKLADAVRAPPYVILSDRSLVEMAAYLPQSPESLLQMHGIGQVKLEHYGADFLDVIQSYCEQRGLVEKSKPGGGRKRAGRLVSGPEASQTETGTQQSRQAQVGEAYNQGLTVAELVEQLGVRPETVLSHLSSYALEGNPLRKSDEFWTQASTADALKQQALEAFQAEGASLLKPVFERLNGAVSYDDLKILRLHFLSHAQGVNSQDR